MGRRFDVWNRHQSNHVPLALVHNIGLPFRPPFRAPVQDLDLGVRLGDPGQRQGAVGRGTNVHSSRALSAIFMRCVAEYTVVMVVNY